MTDLTRWRLRPSESPRHGILHGLRDETLVNVELGQLALQTRCFMIYGSWSRPELQEKSRKMGRGADSKELLLWGGGRAFHPDSVTQSRCRCGCSMCGPAALSALSAVKPGWCWDERRSDECRQVAGSLRTKAESVSGSPPQRSPTLRQGSMWRRCHQALKRK